jgi:hypothetical protein
MRRGQVDSCALLVQTDAIRVKLSLASAALALVCQVERYCDRWWETNLFPIPPDSYLSEPLGSKGVQRASPWYFDTSTKLPQCRPAGW